MKLMEIIEKENKDLELKKELLENFPDLELHSLRWSTQYSSKSINKIVTEFYKKNSCGCCLDSVIKIRPYIKYKNVYIFTNPVEFDIGENSEYNGPNYLDNWKDKFIETEINPILINKVEQYILQQKDKMGEFS